ncbi:two-component system CheB/CheR fusion protein [Pseudomonas sp. BIGb0408]|uniref:Two-component system CheB/CheR fusion protein n=1 Tax=Phytopseudomonas flavescens TaxID=29435 RepID=A0A7Z0BQC2_9GAMM|nr:MULTISPECIES: CheR family methyltransferase [Pseudomonas]MCW2292416.1 two-component system CheB/CheR fusion protein [Pseudomonas sp. BIGb0408]NYH73013.1 two-component system CheB/CheR fusion protein [Pseudomonas flavescens]
MSKPTRNAGTPSTPVEPSHLRFPVVGLGASAGGLSALLRLFEHMPSNNGMAFVVVMHLSPTHESNADSILQKATKMKVRQVSKPVPIEPNCIYLISPGKQLTMNDGYLRVTDMPENQPRNIAIDLFMRTLADAHQERAISVILTGSGSDGSSGLSRVKEQGGVTIAQSPGDAEYDDMPRSAIATGQVDFTLPVIEIPQKLIELWDTMRNIQLPADVDIPTPHQRIQDPEQANAAEAALKEILTLLRTRTGHDFKHYKRATVLRRIERRMQVNRVNDLPAYRTFLQEHTEESKKLLDDMLIGVTNFFRDREAFETLERDIIPRLFDIPSESEAVRVWSAGCSSGEEAYSLSMLLADQIAYSQRDCTYQVFATDIDEHSIATGRTGLYPESVLPDISPARLRQYFTKEQSRYRVKKEIRERVLFAMHSLLRDPPFSKLHLISCRNLLIYLDRDVQAQILQMFHFALLPGGYLFLGSSESADICLELFTPVDKKNRIYRAKAGAAQIRPSSPLPFEANTASVRTSQTASPERRKISFADLHQRVLEQYAPPSVIVNHESDIVHMSDQAGRFLRYVGGEPSHNLLSLIHPSLRLELRTALFQAFHTGKSVEARRVRHQRDERSYYINMIARPFRDMDADFALVLFDEVEETMSADAASSPKEGKDSVLSQLERELQSTKEQLQSTIEQAETSTEELKASNEELQAINEELRSTTEELETSKEELQSINEELITVNQELKSKVEETGQINDDLQNFIASTDIATVFVDRNMRIKSFTPRASEIFSIINSDVGRSLLDITHRLDYADMADDASTAFESLRLIEREVASSGQRWYIARMLPYRTTENIIDGAVLTFIDITERRLAEDRVKEGEERLRLAAETTQDYSIITMDSKGHVTGWNLGAERLYGYAEAEMIGRSAGLIHSDEDRAAGIFEKELSTALEAGRAEDDRWHVRKDGTQFFCSSVLTSLSNGGLHGYAKIGRDITDKKHHEAEQESLLVQNQANDRLKDEFFAMMSHELKHPLNLIQLNAELMSRLSVVKTQAIAARAVHTILGSVRSQARIIDDLLDLSRINTGKFKLNLAPVSLQPCIEEIVGVLQAEATDRDIAITMQMPAAGSDPLVADADPIRVEQIIWNLLNNALKFSENGGVLHVGLSQDEDYLKLTVRDQGEGIAAESLPKIFELFGQVSDHRRSVRKNGLGIGLALVKELVDAHQGKIEVSSPGVGLGATFSVWLPLYQKDDEAVVSTSEAGGHFSGLSILLVDDSEDICMIMEELLVMEGASVTIAHDGSTALGLLEVQEFDLILSDIGMPGMDGHELLRHVRKLPLHMNTAAVALTGYGGSSDIETALEAGFNAHISKPISIETLEQVLIDVMTEKKRAE